MFFFFKQKTAYDMHISDWSSDVCSSDLSSSVQVRALLLIMARSPPISTRGRLSTRNSRCACFWLVALRPQMHACCSKKRNGFQQMMKFRIQQNGRESCRERECQYV